MTTPVALTIAGSDCSGGAGIQADLKTFAALGVYGASVITALTAQNTRGVTAIHDVPPDFVAAQLDAVFSDLEVKAVKIGMVGQLATIDAIASGLARWSPKHIVLDPVMVATSGDRLLAADAVEAEKSIYVKQLEGEGKPAEMLDKIATGKLNKWYSEIALVEQNWIFAKDRVGKDLSVGDYAKQVGATIRGFARFSVKG